MAIRKAVKLADAPELHGATKTPTCPRHNVRMHYSPEKNAWKCVELDCKMIARPDTEIDGKPILGKGPVMFIIDQDPFRIWAKAENNVMVELTQYVIQDDLTLAEGGGIAVRLTLHTDNMVDVSKMQAS